MYIRAQCYSVQRVNYASIDASLNFLRKSSFSRRILFFGKLFADENVL